MRPSTITYLSVVGILTLRLDFFLNERSLKWRLALSEAGQVPVENREPTAIGAKTRAANSSPFDFD